MNLSDTTKILLSYLWENEEPRAISIYIGGKFEHKNKLHKITEKTFQEIEKYHEETNKKFKLYREKNYMSLSGK